MVSFPAGAAPDQVCPVYQIELLIDMADMGLYGPYTDQEPGGNLGHGEPQAKQGCDLGFPAAEPAAVPAKLGGMEAERLELLQLPVDSEKVLQMGQQKPHGHTVMLVEGAILQAALQAHDSLGPVLRILQHDSHGVPDVLGADELVRKFCIPRVAPVGDLQLVLVRAGLGSRDHCRILMIKSIYPDPGYIAPVMVIEQEDAASRSTHAERIQIERNYILQSFKDTMRKRRISDA